MVSKRCGLCWSEGLKEYQKYNFIFFYIAYVENSSYMRCYAG